MKKVGNLLFVFFTLFLFGVGVSAATVTEDAYKKEWKVPYKATESENEFYAALELSDGSVSLGYTCLIYKMRESYKPLCRGLIVKYDKSGNEVWSKTYDKDYSYFFDGTVVEDGVVVLSTIEIDNETHYYLVKYDFNGNVKFSEDLGVSENSIPLFSHIDSYDGLIGITFDNKVLIYKDGSEKVTYVGTIGDGYVYPDVAINKNGIYVSGTNSTTYDTEVVLYDKSLTKKESVIINEVDETLEDAGDMVKIVTEMELVGEDLVLALSSSDGTEIAYLGKDFVIDYIKSVDDGIIIDIVETRGDFAYLSLNSTCSKSTASSKVTLDDFSNNLDVRQVQPCSSIKKYTLDFQKLWEMDLDYFTLGFDNVQGGIVVAGTTEEEEENSYISIGITEKYIYPMFNVTTKDDGNGRVTSSKIYSEEGELIEFVVEPKEGYSLKKVIVKTMSGEVLEFTDYKFTMPSDDVEIYAEFEPVVNPNTGLTNPYVICSLLFVVGLVGYILLKKKKYI